MQFVIIAYDGKDEKALERRMAARDAHKQGLDKLRAEGKALCGVALTDDKGQMIGSMVVMNFPSRVEFDKWLETESYVVNNVWQDITIHSGNLGPSFADLIKKAA